jgi:predicted metal-dependent hydrolase
MGEIDAMRNSARKDFRIIELGGRRVEYRLVISKSARRLRARVGVAGVEVIRPQARKDDEVEGFLRANEKWLISQLKRVEKLRSVRKPPRRNEGEILYRGERVPVHVREAPHRQGANRVSYENGVIVIVKSRASKTPPAKSLENWLRKQARDEITKQLDVITRKLNRFPQKVFVMGQRTKWGNCSALRNLSFNWRLIMAPDFVLRYLVTHEAVHLAVPDHSKKFWLTVSSLCPETERARRWLSSNGNQMLVDFNQITS